MATAHAAEAWIAARADHARLLARTAALQRESAVIRTTARDAIERSRAARTLRRVPEAAGGTTRTGNDAAKPSAALLEALDILVAFDALEETVASAVRRAPWKTDAEVVQDALAEGVPGILADDLSTLVADLEALVHRLRAERLPRTAPRAGATSTRFRPDLRAR